VRTSATDLAEMHRISREARRGAEEIAAQVAHATRAQQELATMAARLPREVQRDVQSMRQSLEAFLTGGDGAGALAPRALIDRFATIFDASEEVDRLPSAAVRTASVETLQQFAVVGDRWRALWKTPAADRVQAALERMGRPRLFP
jgi:hypothetical protein